MNGGRFRARGLVIAHDLVMIPVAWLGAYWLRFNLERVPQPFWNVGLHAMAIVLLIQGASFWYFGLYRGVWRFASLPDMVRIIKAVSVGVVLSAIVLFLRTRLISVPRSVFPLDALLLGGFVSGPRFLYRWFKDRSLYVRSGRRVLIVGAGRAGELLVRDLLHDGSDLIPVAFVDDDLGKIGKEIHGLPVIGGIPAITEVVPDLDIQMILIAIASATSAEVQRVVGVCEQTKIPFRILPRAEALVDGKVRLRELRDVRIEDLLGRQSVHLDWAAITQGVEGRAVLVTGGGGSIGSELCRQIARLNPSCLVILEQSEFNLYSIDLEIRREFPELRFVPVLGDIGDPVIVNQVFAQHVPDIVFHAAAYKHVPLLEEQVRSAVRNNIFGTATLAAAADEHGCRSFVLISSDKAVNPSNIMGVTKRVAEIYCQILNEHSRTRFITVRFGNVLGSAGSVIPLFQKQIASGGPVTVTHPEIMRYFMTIPEACQLILQANVIGEGGEIFVLDMGQPVKIHYLAEQLILLSGKRPGEDIKIVYTGLRAGEKLYEELFHSGEKLRETGHEKIMLALSRQVNGEEFDRLFVRLDRATRDNDEARMKECLLELVPERTGQRDNVIVFPRRDVGSSI
ncbi:MAG: polysaccharide biosynthesis protein [Acidiferrobacteraceae bacterium]